MSKEKVFPKGLRMFKANDGAPSFVVGKLIITPNEFFTWMKENGHLLKDYNGEKQIKFDVLKNDKGLYLQVDTYEKGQQAEVQQAVVTNNSAGTMGGADDLPF